MQNELDQVTSSHRTEYFVPGVAALLLLVCVELFVSMSLGFVLFVVLLLTIPVISFKLYLGRRSSQLRVIWTFFVFAWCFWVIIPIGLWHYLFVHARLVEIANLLLPLAVGAGFAVAGVIWAGRLDEEQSREFVGIDPVAKRRSVIPRWVSFVLYVAITTPISAIYIHQNGFNFKTIAEALAVELVGAVFLAIYLSGSWV